MIRFVCAATIAGAALGLRAGPLAAQTATEWMEQGVQAYQVLDLNAAAGFLRRALDAEPPDTLERRDHVRALAYLGATEFFRDNRDSAQSAFRRIVRIDPRYAIDEVEFPPEVTALYQLARRDTKVVEVEVPAQARLEAGSGMYAAQLYASSFHRVDVALDRPDGSTVRGLYRGVIGDSLEVLWNGFDADGSPLRAGRYVFRVESTTPDGAVARVLRIPLEVMVETPDTVAHPPPPADSLFLPETIESRMGTQALISGLAMGAGIALLPALVAPDASPSAARFAVGGSIAIAGVLGFMKGRPGRTITENVAANQRLRGDWENRVGQVVRQNQARRLEVTLVVTAGRAAVVDAEGQ